MWTVGLTVEIKLRFQIPPAESGCCLILYIKNAVFNGKEKNDEIDYFHTLYKLTDMRKGSDALSKRISWVSVGHFRSVENCGHWNKRQWTMMDISSA